MRNLGTCYSLTVDSLCGKYTDTFRFWGLKHQAFNDNVYIFKTYLTFAI